MADGAEGDIKGSSKSDGGNEAQAAARQHAITDPKKLEADRAKDKQRVDKLLTAFDDSGDDEVLSSTVFWYTLSLHHIA